MWTIFKVFIECVTILLSFHALAFGCKAWGIPASPARDQNCTTCIARQSLSLWPTRKVPTMIPKRLVWTSLAIHWLSHHASAAGVQVPSLVLEDPTRHAVQPHKKIESGGKAYFIFRAASWVLKSHHIRYKQIYTELIWRIRQSPKVQPALRSLTLHLSFIPWLMKTNTS